MAHILVIDDEPKMTSLICGTLEDEGHRVTTSVKPSEGLQLIAKHSFDIVITDLSMPEISGMEILDAALAKGDCEIIMMTAYATAESAIQALKKGAADYLIKPFSLDELVLLVKKLGDKQMLSSLADHYRNESSPKVKIIGSSPAMKRIRRMVEQVAPTDATVLLTGRSGTGKEVAARMIHDFSPRQSRAFIAVNSAALPDTLLESELFGHEKGAFTGAATRKRGRFELADSGTIFLDEIGDVALPMQTKLLRVLEERQLVRLGGVDTIDIDVRVVVATNRNLKDEVLKGTFREDLFYRLNVFPIEMPPLSDRGGDVLELAEHFLAEWNYPRPELEFAVKQLLQQYDWPGNVRELRNVLERAIILAGGEQIDKEDLGIELDDRPLELGDPGARGEGLESIEKELIVQALKKTGGNKTEAARLLKISRRRLYSRMKVHGLKV